MLELIAQNLAPIMFAALVVFLLLGYPVAFSLAAVGMIFFVLGVFLAPYSGGAVNLSWPLLRTLPERIYGVMTNETLLAIPFFAFMGLILERSGMAEDLLETVGQLFGPVRGGLAYAVVFVGTLLAATTGVVAASVISMGLISLPIMLRYGYDPRFAAGTIAASGTLAQIIPPSLVLIVMADQLGRSVGDMYTGALVPGLMLSASYAVFVFFVSTFFPAAAPGLPPKRSASGAGQTSRPLPAVAACSLASCAVFAYFTMRGAPYSGADYVILMLGLGVGLAFARRDREHVAASAVPARAFLSPLSEQVDLRDGAAACCSSSSCSARSSSAWRRRPRAEPWARWAPCCSRAQNASPTATPRASIRHRAQRTQATAKLSAFVMFILVGARIFSLTFYGVNGHKWVEHLLVSLPGGEVGFLVVVNVLVFFLAFFLDFFELAFIIIPLLAPVAAEARHRPRLVRRDPRGQHADELHASAVRLCAVLPALGGAAHEATSTR